MNAQEQFWAGDFGDRYTERNLGRVEANKSMFEQILARAPGVHSIIEFGAGAGENLEAINQLWPKRALAAVEINDNAAITIARRGIHVYRDSILTFMSDVRWDMVMTKGLLIHIAPPDLNAAYEALHRHATKYILICEYYNPHPVEVEYRSEMGRLWKRDFAGDLLDHYSDLRLANYGFVYHRDPFPQDDVNWFLLKKEEK